MWTNLPEIAKACQELLKCGCQAHPLCSRKCKCEDAGSLALLCAIAVEIVIHDQFIFRAFLFCYVISMGSENLNFRDYCKTKKNLNKMS